ncbi:MAG: hypothetical protein AABX11_07335 [Nanoarchaeota archaeon]
MEFVAFIGEDRESWGQISALLNRLEYESCVLVVSSKAEGFPAPENAKVIEVKSEMPLIEMKEFLVQKLKPILKGDFEVSLSIASGNGKEHMAIVSALLNIPVGIKLVVYTKQGIEFLT